MVRGVVNSGCMTSCRVIGPAAPPPEVLEAAAKLTAAEEELRLVASKLAGVLSMLGGQAVLFVRSHPNMQASSRC
jgi:hypothetical protein